jgi:hypothetical protein
MENIATAQPWQIAFFIIGCLVVAVAIIVWLVTGIREDDAPAVTLDPVVLVGQLWSDIIHWRPMSSTRGDDLSKNATVPPVVTTSTAAKQPIVTPNNEYSSGLSDNGRLQFEATAKSIAAMYQRGVITNLSKAICAAYGCTVQSAQKTDSTYQMALKAVNRYLPAKDAPQFRMTPEQEAAREALGLNS